MKWSAIFDMDGLLLDTEPIWGECMWEIAQTYEINNTPNFFKYTTGLRIHEVTEFWKRQFGWRSSISSDKMAEIIVEAVVAKSIAKANVMPGVIATLDFLKSQNITIGVATSSPQYMMDSLLSHFKLDSYFTFCQSAEKLSHGKPHPEVYLACAEQLNAVPYQCVAFEDSLNGIIAAKAARMKAVAVPEPSRLNTPAFQVADVLLSNLEDFESQHWEKLTQY